MDRAHEMEFKVLHRVESEQLTMEMATRALKAGEAFYREMAERELVNGTEWSPFYFNIWSDINDALLGAEGRGPISHTIEYFRTSANGYRKLANEARKIIDEGGPFSGNPFIGLAHKQESVRLWENSARNDDRVARLFGSKMPKFAVSGE